LEKIQLKIRGFKVSENLDNRKKKILQAIVEEYIETAEPVSSGNLVKELDCSSATIRNEMAELESIGFLEKTHTSSGRIPSQKGYRYYVDQLVRDDNLTQQEMEIIRQRLETKVNGLEELVRIATTTLSEITHYTTVAVRTRYE
jgi:heat-inducible transcriptional repressor